MSKNNFHLEVVQSLLIINSSMMSITLYYRNSAIHPQLLMDICSICFFLHIGKKTVINSYNIVIKLKFKTSISREYSHWFWKIWRNPFSIIKGLSWMLTDDPLLVDVEYCHVLSQSPMQTTLMQLDEGSTLCDTYNILVQAMSMS